MGILNTRKRSLSVLMDRMRGPQSTEHARLTLRSIASALQSAAVLEIEDDTWGVIVSFSDSLEYSPFWRDTQQGTTYCSRVPDDPGPERMEV